jgi:hypothetical protein
MYLSLEEDIMRGQPPSSYAETTKKTYSAMAEMFGLLPVVGEDEAFFGAMVSH